MYKFFGCICLLAVGGFGIPMQDDLMFEGSDDTATVESTVRETRAAPSHIGDLVKPGVKNAFLHVYGDAENDDGDVHGYSKKLNDKGQDGYKHYDSFHKKDGDKYGYEKHSEYGQEHKAGVDSENDKGIQEAHAEAGGEKTEDDGEETRKSYAVFEDLNEDEKKQPKKKIESDYGYEGEADSGSYYEGSEASEGDGESESTEGDDGDGENEESESTEESEEGDEESDY
ncbi:unnamed protein product [Ceutorhynchus assimilis]|uniref:Uncharacterized protein n=1 Tax=Ceutorhynchus assimilis TaxID=467358 RepID=A0A9N9QNG9_9CUCU|nr:unnamed protein product [Ceutorhynchus assimilis]